MIRIQRLIYYICILLFFGFISFTLLPSLKEVGPTPSPVEVNDVVIEVPKKSNYDPNQEKYLSWFPHSDFPEQQEAFRNGLRLALETKRTIIAPMLRINNIYPWMPFEELAKRYEAQDKSKLREDCAKKTSTWRTELEGCDTLNDWFEIPWSSIMDLKTIKREYGIRIIERTNGHGWGIHESALQEKILPEDVAIVDVMTYKENGTNWERIDTEKQEIKENKFTSWIQQNFLATKEEKLTEPLKYVLTEDKLMEIDEKIIQFGALSSAARYATSTSEIQLDLRKAMMKSRFNVPNQLATMTKQADQIVNALGGKFQYSTLILNLSKLVALDARAGTIQNLAVDGPNAKKVNNEEDQPNSMEDLSQEAKNELMEAVVLEIFGDIPINQAISAAMPIKPETKLSELLKGGKTMKTTTERRELLDACVDYHKNVETRYPVYYLMNDMNVAPETRPDIFEPLTKMFPCVFSTADMKKWGIQTDDWAKDEVQLDDSNVNYEKLFQPLLDILIAGKGYSFFEIPTTPLTRFLNWSPKA